MSRESRELWDVAGERSRADGRGEDSMGVFFFLTPCALFSVLWGGGSLPREV